VAAVNRTARWLRRAGVSCGRLPRWARAALRAGCGLLLAGTIGVALLLAVTPSAGSAAARTRQWIASHRAGPPLTALPERITAAVLAVEDHRFYQHPGVDPLALARVGRGVLTGQDEGGSTIEVQLAKLLYTGGRRGLLDQAEQATLAVKLDRAFSKTQILLMYLNSEYFGHGFYGITAAARGYFHTAPQDLTWGQAALLAGLLKAPSYDDPLRHPDRALARRRHVLDRLHAVGVLTAAQAAATDRTDLQLARPVSAEPIPPVDPAHP
jgi:membrane peptidoglycan carboxypeptidase